VLIVPYRNPVVTAKMVSSLDALSGGRVILGVGAGWLAEESAALGVPFAERGPMTDEYLAAMRELWTSPAPSFAGKYTQFSGLKFEPKPVQQPHPPIVVGGGGQKLLTLAGREADIVGINPNLRKGEVTGDAVQSAVAAMTKQKIEWVREGAGDRFDDLELQIRYFMGTITDDPLALAEAIAPGFGLEPQEALDSGVALAGTVDTCVETLQQRREEWGVSYVVFGEDNFEQFAPVVAALAGT
jgi:probable F420-dependent oxidoreductase